jgi:3-hydroxyisobutyrate dehydrogenase
MPHRVSTNVEPGGADFSLRPKRSAMRHAYCAHVNIAIIGAGEVGRTYAKAVAERSAHTAILCDPYPKDATLRFASEAGLALHREAGTWLADVDRVWLCVTGDLTLSVCRDLLWRLRPGTVVVDLTTAAPGDKRTAFDLAAEHGVQYVDAVILGAIALSAAATPLLAAGPAGPDAMRDLADLGAPVRILPQARVGDAAALKLLRTILTKGLEALAVECLVAAEKQGIRRELYDAMRDVDAVGFTAFLDMLVRTHIQHSGRRLHEVQRAEAQLTSMGLPASMLSASQQVFARTTRAAAQNPPPAAATADVEAALEWLASTSAGAL